MVAFEYCCEVFLWKLPVQGLVVCLYTESVFYLKGWLNKLSAACKKPIPFVLTSWTVLQAPYHRGGRASLNSCQSQAQVKQANKMKTYFPPRNTFNAIFNSSFRVPRIFNKGGTTVPLHGTREARSWFFFLFILGSSEFCHTFTETDLQWSPRSPKWKHFALEAGTMDEQDRTEWSSYCSRTGENKASLTDVGLSTCNKTCWQGGDKMFRLIETELPGLCGVVLDW